MTGEPTRGGALPSPEVSISASTAVAPSSGGSDVAAVTALHDTLIIDCGATDVVELGFVQTITTQTALAFRLRRMKRALMSGETPPAPTSRVDQDGILEYLNIAVRTSTLVDKWLDEMNLTGVVERARAKRELEPRRAAEEQRLWEEWKRRKAAEPPKQVPPKAIPKPATTGEVSTPQANFARYHATIDFLNSIIHRAEALRDRAIRDWQHYRTTLKDLAATATVILDGTSGVRDDDVRPQTRRKSAQRPKKHGSANAVRPHKGEPERPPTRARRSRLP